VVPHPLEYFERNDGEISELANSLARSLV